MTYLNLASKTGWIAETYKKNPVHRIIKLTLQNTNFLFMLFSTDIPH